MLSFVCAALAIVCGAWLALFVLQSAIGHLAVGATSSMTAGGRLGGLAMILPGFWLAVFVGAPMFGGMAIGMAGEQAMQIGAILGIFTTQFFSVAFGGIVGASLSLIYHWVAIRLGPNP